jgi:hypothetical protein
MLGRMKSSPKTPSSFLNIFKKEEEQSSSLILKKRRDLRGGTKSLP